MTDKKKIVDLWGNLITEPVKRTPLTILKEQGSLLERKTKGILTVKVVSDKSVGGFSFPNLFTNADLPDNKQLRHLFYIESPNLNYTYHLFTVLHPIDLFPTVFYTSEGDNQIANNEEEFLAVLSDILQSSKTQKVIHSLLSQNIAA